MASIQYAAEHLVRRAATTLPDTDDLPKNMFKNVSRGGTVAILLTAFFFAAILICIRYTLWKVVATLAYIEKDDKDLPLDPPAYTEDAEPLTPRHGAITNKIRTTLAHLRAIGGPRALWRGAACAISYQLAFILLSALLTALLRLATLGKLPYLDQIVASLLVTLALIHWQTAWTHIVISEPSPQPWLRRVPPFRRTLSNVWLATVVHELASRVAFVAPMAMFFALGLSDPSAQGVGALFGKSIAVLAVALVLGVAIVIPANVALSRVQASMLPDEDETIVPFDRAFGGQVEPAIVGGSGAISFMDAWRTFDRPARVRVVKLCFKIVLVELALHVIFGAVLGIEFAVFKKKGGSS